MVEGDFRSFVPVVGNNGIIYRNRYCGLCNGANVEEKIVSFDIIYQGCINKVTKPEEVDRKSEQQAKEALNLNNFLSQIVNCTVSLCAKDPFHNSMIQLCTFLRNPKVYESNTNKCTEMEQNLCLSFSALTRSGDDSNDLFYNPMCAKCLHGSSYPTRFDKCIEDFHIVNPNLLGHSFTRFTPFSVLISFRKKTTVRLITESEFGDRKIHDSVQCKKNEHFDLMEESCVKMPEILSLMSLSDHKVDGVDLMTSKCWNTSFHPMRYEKDHKAFTLDGKINNTMTKKINKTDVNACGNKRSNALSISSVDETWLHIFMWLLSLGLQYSFSWSQ